MPEINNSLAASITPLDVGGALAKAAQLREATAKADLAQQAYQHNEREYGENAGLTSGERATMSNTQREAMGPIGNILSNDQSPQARQQAISLAKRAGIPMDDMTAGHLMTAHPDQVKQYGINAQRLGMSSSTNVEQGGTPAGNREREAGKYMPQDVPAGDNAISNRTAVATGTAGQPTQAQVDNAVKTGRNFDGSPRALSTADVTGVAPGPSFDQRFKGDMFTPGIVKNPDGTLSSNITPGAQAMRAQAVKQYEKAGEVAQTAQGLSMRLDMMDHSADVLNTAGWSATGAGANAKLGAAKSVNSLLQTVGLPPAIDPNKVANWEDLNKETTRAGFDLARTLGSREAATIVQSSVSAVPGAESTPMGFKLVSSGIRQAIQREKDYYTFATDYAKTHRGNTFGADVEFNKQFPPDLYSKTAVANAIPPAAINMMKGDPKLAGKFDEKYGSGMSAFILHHDQAR
jgi:hypothetical protein